MLWLKPSLLFLLLVPVLVPASAFATGRGVTVPATTMPATTMTTTSQGDICTLGTTRGYVATTLAARGVPLRAWTAAAACDVLIVAPAASIAKPTSDLIDTALRGGRQVVLDGASQTAADALRLQRLSLALAGAGFKADAVVILRSAQGGGRTAVPLFTPATIARMVAAHELKAHDMDHNTVDNYFGLAATSRSSVRSSVITD